MSEFDDLVAAARSGILSRSWPIRTGNAIFLTADFGALILRHAMPCDDPHDEAARLRSLREFDDAWKGIDQKMHASKPRRAVQTSVRQEKSSAKELIHA